MDVHLGEAEIIYIEGGVLQNLRNDGRGNDEYRPIMLETGLINNAYGSARIRLGNTDVLVAVKAEIDKPLPSAPDRGRVQFFVDCSANATPEFEGKGGNELAEDIASSLSTAYANDIALDCRRLCLVNGKICWLLYIDVVILECGGNVYDASSLAIKAALFNLKMPNVRLIADDKGETDIELLDDPNDYWRLDVSSAPLLVTVAKIGMGNVVDMTQEEEVCSKAALIVGVSETKEKQQFITLVKKMRGGSLDPDSLDEMIGLAVRVGTKLQENFIEKLSSESQYENKTVGFMSLT